MPPYINISTYQHINISTDQKTERRDRQTGRRTDRQTDRQPDRPTDRPTEGLRAYVRRPLQSVENARLQPSKSTMFFNIQAQAERQQIKQLRMTHACSSLGWTVQNLINYSSYRRHSSLQSGTIQCHRPPTGLAQNPANVDTKISRYCNTEYNPGILISALYNYCPYAASRGAFAVQ